ncbi:Hsp70 family protein, partial [Candidatus Bathyarchaeota archaeon]|nr:Hsp70 family protein [Candidatus Bathyarchaeota archaeon]
LGSFNLEGIPPAPRGVPQIEVTFDINADGVLDVTAKDLGTGKQMSITITASTKLSDSEKERMVTEAEQYAEADKQAKEEAETRNEADTLIYSTEKMLGELADKISGDVKARIQGSLDALKNAVKEGSVAEIKAKMEELQRIAQEAGSEIYKQAAAAQQAEQAAGAQQQGPEEEQGKKTVDADFKVVDEDKKQ